MNKCCIALVVACFFVGCQTNEPSVSTLISSLSIESGKPGTEVTITGSGFGESIGDNTVTFNGVTAEIISASPTQLIVRVPVAAGDGPVVVTTPGGSFTTTDPFKYEPDVFAAGIEYSGTHYVGKYWKNGVGYPVDEGDYTINLLTMAVSGEDIYVAGATASSGVLTATYWKNGEAVTLGDGKNSSLVYSIFLSGGDVYASGYQDNSNHSIARYWKNGVATDLTDGTGDAVALSIVVSGNDVHVSGYATSTHSSEVAVYWKNGNRTTLTDDKILSSASSTTLAGSDVYIVGYDYGTPAVEYWKNGDAHQLSLGGSHLVDHILVLDGIVYVAGKKDSSAGYWKNTDFVTLSTKTSFCHHLALFGGDVYAVGSESNGKFNVGKYWRNGAEVNLTDGSRAASMWGIVVR